MRRSLGVVLVTAVASVSVPMDAHASVRDTYRALYKRVASKHGVRAPGRNIARWGIATRRGARHARPREIRGSIAVLRRMLAPAREHLVAPTRHVTTAPVATPAPSSSTAGAGLERIAQCESGGNPAAVDPTGTYRGKYQFDLQTWQSVGGSGDPAAAPEAEQDRRAARLQQIRGNAPWPVCGSR